MKKIIGILLIGFLGFLGCSGDDGTSTFTGEAIPVAPFGNISNETPTYEWTFVPGATRYQLIVEIESISDPPMEVLIEEWYTAEEAGCASGDVLCSQTPHVSVFGRECTWKVMACVDEDCGVWSDELQFGIKSGIWPGYTRFIDNGDGTVTDSNTNLMWTKNTCPYQRYSWGDALALCGALTFAGYSDWRLSSVAEMYSLFINTSCSVDPWPPGHPFVDIRTTAYWTSTSRPSVTNMEAFGISVGIVPPELCSLSSLIRPVRAFLLFKFRTWESPAHNVWPVRSVSSEG